MISDGKSVREKWQPLEQDRYIFEILIKNAP